MDRDTHLIFETYQLNGKAKDQTLEDLAQKHKVDIEKLRAQLEKGIKTEHEHTKDEATAKKIAMDHLTEDPGYYDKLSKMEKEEDAEMPYPEFAKLSKSAASKLPEDKPRKKLEFTYEKATAYLPRDIDISTREGQDEVLSLAYEELVKLYTGKYKNPRLAARNTFDEDFPMEVLSQYRYYQKHGFPDVEKEDDFREQMPDSREEYSAQDYAKEMELKGEDEERRLDPKCWSGYHKQGTKMKGGVRVNNCVKNEQEETTLPSLYQFHKMLQRHDWTYQYSDDSDAYRRGQQQERAISDAINKGGQPYQDLYDKYVKQQEGGEKFEAPQKDKAELEQDRALLNDMKSAIEDLRDKMYHDIDANSIYHPQQLWDIYYPAINILKVMRTIATDKGYKTLIKSLDQYNI